MVGVILGIFIASIWGESFRDIPSQRQKAGGISASLW